MDTTMSIPESEDEALLLGQHLGVVADKVRLCRELLQESPGIAEDDLLADVVGFLEACSERMPDVIEAGAAGLLTEELFSEALRVNDALMRTLDAEKNGTRISLEDDALTASTAQSNLLDFDETSAPAKPSSKVQASLLDADDDSGLDYKSTTTSSGAGKTVKDLSENFKGGNFKAVGHHLGSPFAVTTTTTNPHPKPVLHQDNPFGDAQPSDNVFGNSATSVNDIDLLLKDDTAPQPKKENNDLDFLK